MRLKVILVLLIIPVVFSGCQSISSDQVAQAQHSATPVPNTNVAVVDLNAKRPPDAGQIDGKVSDFPLTDLTFETFKRLPVPEIWFVSECQADKPSKLECVDGKAKIELPAETKPLIEEQWKQTLTFIYRLRMKKFTDPQNASDQIDNKMRKGLRFKEVLQEYSIEAPNGRRNISQTEAGDIGGFLTESASDAIERAKRELN